MIESGINFTHRSGGFGWIYHQSSQFIHCEYNNATENTEDVPTATTMQESPLFPPVVNSDEDQFNPITSHIVTNFLHS